MSYLSPSSKRIEALKDPLIVKSKDELPEGIWLTVVQASKVIKMSRMGIYTMFRNGRVDGARIGSKSAPLLININSITTGKNDARSIFIKRKRIKSRTKSKNSPQDGQESNRGID